MPGPGGVNPVLSRGQMTYSPPGGQPEETQKQNYLGSALSAISGKAGPLVGAAFDYFTQLQSQHEQESFNSREAAKARHFSAQQASAAQAFNRGEARWAAAWNSPEHQVQQFKAAGLSPGLMMGQMSPSTAQAATGSPGASSQAASAAASSSSFGKAVDSMIQKKAVDSTAALQSTEAARNEVESLHVQIDNMSLHQRNLAAYEQMLASGELDRENAERVRLLRDNEAEQLRESINNLISSTKKLDAESKFIAEVQTPNVQSQTSLNKSQKGLVDAQTDTEKERPELVRQQAQSESFNQDLAAARANEINLANREYRTMWDHIEKVLVDNGYDKTYTPFALKFLSHVFPEVAQKGAQVVESWLDAGNWLQFFSRWISSKNIGKANAYEHIQEDEKKN